MQNPFNAVAQWWHNWTAARANVASIDCCGADETDRIAHDIGVSASELRALAGKWPDSADLLNRRLATLALDPADIRRTEPQVLSDLQRVCTMCRDERKCRHDLADDPYNPAWRDYCPNVVTFDALDAERLQRRGRARRAGHAKAS
jgi:hypothetical protein